MYGYIYLRDNEWFKTYDILKMGISTSIKDRSSGYITGEIKRGIFIKIIQLKVTEKQLKLIDNLLKNHFKYLNFKFDASTELFKKEIEELLEPFLIKINIPFTVVNEKDLKRINRTNKEKEVIYNKYLNLIYKARQEKKSGIIIIKPKDYQLSILETIKDFYDNNDIGKLLWCCGLGKSIMSLLIAQKLGFKKIIIGVSSCFLQLQFKEEVLRIFGVDNSINIIITTYHSSHLYLNENFDFKIGDECHHLVGADKDELRTFIQFHKIKANKSLYMTATERTITSNTSLSPLKIKNKFSMDDEKIFGKTIDEKQLKWAICNEYITNYQIIMIKNTFDEYKIIKDSLKSTIKNRDLYISTYIALKSLVIKPTSLLKANGIEYIPTTPHHILIYTNTIKDANDVDKYITEIVKSGIIDIKNLEKLLFHKSLHSGLNANDIKENIKKFEESVYGIIPCVQIFGEGVNCPKLNAICIACNMMSEINIYQKFLRPNRINKDDNNKIAYYILPSITDEDFKNSSYIIKQLSMIDNGIEQKIKLMELKPKINDNNNKQLKIKENNNDLIENKDLLLRIKLKLKHSKDLKCDFTEEQNEYNYIQSINKSLNLESRQDYYNNRNKHNYFIENPDNYFIKKGVWINWNDYLGYDVSKLIATKERWLNFCLEKEIKNLEEYIEATKIYPELPKDPEDFYNDFSNIEYELQSDIIKI